MSGSGNSFFGSAVNKPAASGATAPFGLRQRNGSYPPSADIQTDPPLPLQDRRSRFPCVERRICLRREESACARRAGTLYVLEMFHRPTNLADPFRRLWQALKEVLGAEARRGVLAGAPAAVPGQVDGSKKFPCPGLFMLWYGFCPIPAGEIARSPSISWSASTVNSV
jgi:hypothetical protein